MLPNAQFMNETPDIYRWGPLLYGLLNEPLSDDSEIKGPIVINWSFRYLPGKEFEVKKILSKTIQYYGDIGEYGTILQNFRFDEFEGGYTVISVFTDAKSFETHLNNTLYAPFYTEIVQLN